MDTDCRRGPEKLADMSVINEVCSIFRGTQSESGPQSAKPTRLTFWAVRCLLILY